MLDFIEPIDYFLFDLDGTLYPRFILLDLALDYFHKSPRIYNELGGLLQASTQRPFKELLPQFAALLKGVEVDSFNRRIPHFFSNFYPYAIQFIELLNDNGKTCFLVSLTSSDIAKEVKNKFHFADFYCLDLLTEELGGINYFSGEYPQLNCDLPNYKLNCLEQFGICGKPFFMAGNSTEDLLLFQKSTTSVAINPPPDFQSKHNFDLILNNDKDPWSSIYK